MNRLLTLAAVILMTAACSADPGATPPPPTGPTAAPTASPTTPRTSSVPTDDGPTEAVPTDSVPTGDGRLDTQLIAAAWKNDLAAARRLIAAGADVNAVDDTVQSAFLIAASEGYLGLLELTLQHGADVRSLDSYRGTALIRAAERGHAAVVARLLRAGITVDHVNRLGWTALHEAVLLGEGTTQYVETVRLLVAAGADRHRPAERDGTTPVRGARDLGQVAVSAVLEAEPPGRESAPAPCWRQRRRVTRTGSRRLWRPGRRWRAATSTGVRRCCWRRHITGSTWPGCWSGWGRTRTRRTTGWTRPGW